MEKITVTRVIAGNPIESLDILLPDSIDSVAFITFIRFMADGLRHGEETYGSMAYMNRNMKNEIKEEWRDAATWAFLGWDKMRRIQDGKEE